jgi:hypothetical protein
MSLAVRVDAKTGIEERLEFIPTSQGSLYSWIARPHQTRSCVLICSSVFGDFTSNYHRERLLGRTLASRGLGVVRFHYAGEGNSSGERPDITFSSLASDAEAVLAYAEDLGFSQFAVLGTRLGALVGAATVASMGSIPLALWEPIVDPIQFISDAQRAIRISRLAGDDSHKISDWRQVLEQHGVLDLLGYDVYPALIESLMDIDLLTCLGNQPRPVLIARFRGVSEDGDMLDRALVDRGFLVERLHFRLAESWWFDSELTSDSGDLIPRTAAWLGDALMVDP